jgi:hypothetical protein
MDETTTQRIEETTKKLLEKYQVKPSKISVAINSEDKSIIGFYDLNRSYEDMPDENSLFEITPEQHQKALENYDTHFNIEEKNSYRLADKDNV